MAHLVMHRGESRVFHLEINSERTGADVDLTDATLQFVAYTDPTDDPPQVDVAAEITDAEAGLADVAIPPEATEDLPTSKNTTLYYVLRRLYGGNTDVVDSGMLIVRAVA